MGNQEINIRIYNKENKFYTLGKWVESVSYQSYMNEIGVIVDTNYVTKT